MDIDKLCGSYIITHINAKRTSINADAHFYRDDEKILVVIVLNNTLQGNVEYCNGILKGKLFSCAPSINEEERNIEKALIDEFESGFTVSSDKNNLLALKGVNDSYVFLRTMTLDTLFGTHAIIFIDGATPDREMTMKFIDDGRGGTFITAKIVNTIRGNCKVIGAILRGEVAVSNEECNLSLLKLEAKIIRGLQHGFQISLNNAGILLHSDECSLQLFRIVEREDLAGEYLLKTFNDERVVTRAQSTISFVPNELDNQVKIFIVVNNRIRGLATLEQNIIVTEEPLLSTCLDGTKEEKHLETTFNEGFQNGFEVSLYDKELMLKNEGGEFIFLRAIHQQAKNGQATYKGTLVLKCFEAHENGLLFRIVNEIEYKWAFYNDSVNYRMHVKAIFGARSVIESLDNATLYIDSNGKHIVEVVVGPQTTEMFICGKVNGYSIFYDAVPI